MENTRRAWAAHYFSVRLVRNPGEGGGGALEQPHVRNSWICGVPQYKVERRFGTQDQQPEFVNEIDSVDVPGFILM